MLRPASCRWSQLACLLSDARHQTLHAVGIHLAAIFQEISIGFNRSARDRSVDDNASIVMSANEVHMLSFVQPHAGRRWSSKHRRRRLPRCWRRSKHCQPPCMSMRQPKGPSLDRPDTSRQLDSSLNTTWFPLTSMHSHKAQALIGRTPAASLAAPSTQHDEHSCSPCTSMHQPRIQALVCQTSAGSLTRNFYSLNLTPSA